MPTKTYWIEEPYLMSADYIGTVTVSDLNDVMTTCLEAVKNQRVYFVVDMSQAIAFPKNILRLAALSDLINHPNSRWFAFVKPNPFIRFAVQAIHRHSVKMYLDRETAIAFLQGRLAEENKMLKESHV